jgi:rubrerythrin
MKEQMNCLRCSQPMHTGFQVDDVSRESYRQAQWAPGPPHSKEGKFLGMKMFEEWCLEIKKEDLKPIVTWRCPECGYLEQYAY